MGRDLTVATVLRSGAEYTPEWVHRLRRQVSEHLGVDHRFVCLSDIDVEGVDTIPLKHYWPGYWAKLELYRPDLFDGQVLYLDLDTLIVDDISHLSGYDGRFAALRDFYNPDIQASGVLMFDGDDPPPLYDLALTGNPRMRKNARTDLWWNEHAKADVIQDIYPGLIGSYKVHGLDDGPGDFSVVCFHGNPRQHELVGTWVDRAWRYGE